MQGLAPVFISTPPSLVEVYCKVLNTIVFPPIIDYHDFPISVRILNSTDQPDENIELFSLSEFTYITDICFNTV